MECSLNFNKTKTNILIEYTLILILVASDKTHLTNFSEDKELWPVHIRIGNIDSIIWNKFSINTWVALAFLLIPPKSLEGLLAILWSSQNWMHFRSSMK